MSILHELFMTKNLHQITTNENTSSLFHQTTRAYLLPRKKEKFSRTLSRLKFLLGNKLTH